ncbi:hypothetical protein K470DRAFT_260178 [Piedraia hortae CBS 480.64]|uniref:DUF7357 domain-containing protein n=1 Tax=Piedraia hortae CBS 480.64 TaxID=1314780 RepID=A0A6A7BSP7_9PEZI|nr:hypothetical protein K470DRAFT_260178 [Piedraia hortae CBS 480.64]
MRLRLRIHRHGLPTVSTLWPVEDVQLMHTTSQLLENVNQTFPLEGDDWGYEHYTVTIGGFECLHYQIIDKVFRDEDEVVIRPLEYVERRERQLAGRDQISQDGRHLVDGIPWGKPNIRGVQRPEVRISPLKKRKLEDDGAEYNGAPLMSDGSDESSDEDWKDDGSSASSEVALLNERTEEYGEDSASDSSSFDGLSDVAPSDPPKLIKPSKSAVDDSNSTSDKSFEECPEVVAGAASVHESNQSSSSSSTSDSDFSESDSESSDSESESSVVPSSSSESESDASSSEPVKEAASPLSKEPSTGIPFQGKAETKLRNRRRTEAKQLKKLQSCGILPPTATFETLRQYLAGKTSKPETIQEKEKEPAQETLDVKRKRLIDQIHSGGVQVDSGYPQIPAELVPPAVRRAKAQPAPARGTSLGVCGKRKASKMTDEEDTTQPKVKDAKTPIEAGESWRDRLEVSAVECCDEGITLSAPPFPFCQSWEYAGRKKKRKVGARASNNSTSAPIEYYEKYNPNGNDALDYDGEMTAEPGAASFLLNESSCDTAAEQDDVFPEIPPVVSELASLSETEAGINDIIVFKDLSVSAATNWQPKIVMRAARLKSKNEDGAWEICLAPQQVERKYDDSGNRIYDKFETEFEEETERTVRWNGLFDVRLLQKGQE